MYQYIDLKAKSRNFQNWDVKNPTLYTVKYDYIHGKYFERRHVQMLLMSKILKLCVLNIFPFYLHLINCLVLSFNPNIMWIASFFLN